MSLLRYLMPQILMSLWEITLASMSITSATPPQLRRITQQQEPAVLDLSR